MDSAIIVAIITGGASLLGVVITNLTSMGKIRQELKIQQAVTEEKIENLTREVRRHNNFAERLPEVEAQLKGLQEKVDFLHK